LSNRGSVIILKGWEWNAEISVVFADIVCLSTSGASLLIKYFSFSKKKKVSLTMDAYYFTWVFTNSKDTNLHNMDVASNVYLGQKLTIWAKIVGKNNQIGQYVGTIKILDGSIRNFSENCLFLQKLL